MASTIDQPQSIDAGDDAALTDLLGKLQDQLGTPLAVLCPQQGRWLDVEPHPPLGDRDTLAPLARAVADGQTPEVIAEEGPLVVLAIPVHAAGRSLAAVAPLVVGRVESDHETTAAAKLLGRSPEAARQWIEQQPVWTIASLLKLAGALSENHALRAHNARLEHELDKVSDHLAATYEEISLLYGITQNLRISSSEDELGRMTLQWLLDVLPAEAVAIYWPEPAPGDSVPEDEPVEPRLVHCGHWPLDDDALPRLIDALDPVEESGPVVVNRNVTDQPRWQYPAVREAIVVPLQTADKTYGFLVAINHSRELEFGTVEASLLSSVAAILGIHSGNLDLFRQQADLLTSVVRALTSAIDAKDPYTCGHSDRVGRIAVCLARAVGIAEESLDRVYMAGLLHDIGKIGIDDGVLRKPGRLTDAEFEHIKLHPGLGHKILGDLKQLKDVLPAVLYHHEQWDGTGYPDRLAGEEIPRLARIVAVADAFDAMISDRPYRRGLPAERVQAIFQSGSGTQWDPQVVEALLSNFDRISEIALHERVEAEQDILQWV